MESSTVAVQLAGGGTTRVDNQTTIPPKLSTSPTTMSLDGRGMTTSEVSASPRSSRASLNSSDHESIKRTGNEWKASQWKTATGLPSSASTLSLPSHTKETPSFSEMLKEIDHLNDNFNRRHSDVPDVSVQPIMTLTAVDLKWSHKTEIEYGHYVFFKIVLPKKKVTTPIGFSGLAIAPSTSIALVTKALFFYFKAIGGEAEIYISTNESQKRPTKHEHMWSIERGSRGEFSITSRSDPKFNLASNVYYIGITCHMSHPTNELIIPEPHSSVAPKKAKDNHTVTVIIKIYASNDEFDDHGTSSDNAQIQLGSGAGGFAHDHLLSLSLQKKDMTIQGKIAAKVKSLKSHPRVLANFQKNISGIIQHRLQAESQTRGTGADPNWQSINKHHTQVGLQSKKAVKDQLLQIIRPMPNVIEVATPTAATLSPTTTSPHAAMTAEEAIGRALSPHITIAQPFHFHSARRQSQPNTPPTEPVDPTAVYSTFGQNLGSVTPASPQQLARPSKRRSTHQRIQGKNDMSDGAQTISAAAPVVSKKLSIDFASNDESELPNLSLLDSFNPDDYSLDSHSHLQVPATDSPRFQLGIGPASIGGNNISPSTVEFRLPFALDAPPLAAVLAASNESKSSQQRPTKDKDLSAASSSSSSSATTRHKKRTQRKDEPAASSSTTAQTTVVSEEPSQPSSPPVAVPEVLDAFHRFNFLDPTAPLNVPLDAVSEEGIQKVLKIPIALDDVLSARRQMSPKARTMTILPPNSPRSQRPSRPSTSSGLHQPPASPSSAHSSRPVTSHSSRPLTSSSTRPSPPSTAGAARRISPTRFSSQPPPPPNALAREHQLVPGLDLDGTVRSLREVVSTEQHDRQELTELLRVSESFRADQQAQSLKQIVKSSKARRRKPSTKKVKMVQKVIPEPIQPEEAKEEQPIKPKPKESEASETQEDGSGSSEDEDDALLAAATASVSTPAPLPAELAPPLPELSPIHIDDQPQSEYDTDRHKFSRFIHHSVAADLRSARKALNSSLRARQTQMGTGGRSTLVAGVLGDGHQRVGVEFRDKADPAKWVGSVFACRSTATTTDPEVRGIREALTTGLPQHRADRNHVYGFLATPRERGIGPDGVRIVRNKNPIAPAPKEDLLMEIHQSRGHTPHIQSPRESQVDQPAPTHPNSRTSSRGVVSRLSLGGSRPASGPAISKKNSTNLKKQHSLVDDTIAQQNQTTLAMLNSPSNSSVNPATTAPTTDDSSLSNAPVGGPPSPVRFNPQRAGFEGASKFATFSVTPTPPPKTAPRFIDALPVPTSDHKRTVSFPDSKLSQDGFHIIVSPPISVVKLRPMTAPALDSPTPAAEPATSLASAFHSRHSENNAGSHRSESRVSNASSNSGIIPEDDTTGESLYDPNSAIKFIPPTDVDILRHIRESKWWAKFHPQFHQLPTDILSLIAILLDWGRSFLPALTQSVESLESALLNSLLHLPAAPLSHPEYLESTTSSFFANWLRQQDAIFRARLGGFGDIPGDDAHRRHEATIQYIPMNHPLRETPVWLEQKKTRAKWVEMDRKLYTLLTEARYRVDEFTWELDQLAERMQDEHLKRQQRRIYEERSKKGHTMPVIPTLLPSELKNLRKKTPSEQKRSFALDRDLTEQKELHPPPPPSEYSKPSSWGITCFTPTFTELPPKPPQTVMERVMTARLTARQSRKKNRTVSGSQTARAATTAQVAAPNFEQDPFPPNPNDMSGEESDSSPSTAVQSTRVTPVPPASGHFTTAFPSAPHYSQSNTAPINTSNVWTGESGRSHHWTKFMAPPERLAKKTGFAQPIRKIPAGNNAIPIATAEEKQLNQENNDSTSTSVTAAPPVAEPILVVDPAVEAAQVAKATEAAKLYARQQRQIALAKLSSDYSTILAESRAEREIELASLSRREKTKALVRRGFSVSFDNQMATLVNPLPDALSLASRHDTEPSVATIYEEARRARQFGDEPLNMYLPSAAGPTGEKLTIYERDIMRRNYRAQKLQARTAAARRKVQKVEAERRPVQRAQEDDLPPPPYDPEFDDVEFEETNENAAEQHLPTQTTVHPSVKLRRRFTSAAGTNVALLSPAIRRAQFEQIHNRVANQNIAEIDSSSMLGPFNYISIEDIRRQMNLT